jgi:membrane associated rhomboid family serine protease
MPYDNTANLAHLVGLVIGIFTGLFLRRIKKKRKKKVYAELSYEIPERYMKSWEEHYLTN